MSDNKIHCNRNVYVKLGWTQEVGMEVGGTFCTNLQIYVKALVNKNATKLSSEGSIVEIFSTLMPPAPLHQNLPKNIPYPHP